MVFYRDGLRLFRMEVRCLSAVVHIYQLAYESITYSVTQMNLL